MRMRKLIFLCFCHAFVLAVPAQTRVHQQIADSILTEAKRLLRSEKASRDGAEIFMAKFAEKEKLGGYFSYEEGRTIKCIFFLKGEQPKVVGTISFDTAFDRRKIRTDLAERNMSPAEQDYFRICNNTYAVMKEDSMFRYYQNTSLHLIPLISGNERKVYIITGSAQAELVMFGNDYLISFDQDFRAIQKNRLHAGLIVAPYGNNSDGVITMAGNGMHTHLAPGVSEYMTATDLYLLMLYKEQTGWEQYMVKGKTFVSVWRRDGNTLLIIPKEEMDPADQ